jgi:hypothetical protein
MFMNQIIQYYKNENISLNCYQNLSPSFVTAHIEMLTINP